MLPTRRTPRCWPPSRPRWCRGRRIRRLHVGQHRTPKAVVHGQWAVARQPPVLATYFDVQPADRTLSLLPAFWMGGISAALQVLSTGSTLVYSTSPDIDVVLDTIATPSGHQHRGLAHAGQTPGGRTSSWHRSRRRQDHHRADVGRERRPHPAPPADPDARDVGELRAAQRGAGEQAPARVEGRCRRPGGQRHRTAGGGSAHRRRGGARRGRRTATYAVAH